jgi:hypothetical protein
MTPTRATRATSIMPGQPRRMPLFWHTSEQTSGPAVIFQVSINSLSRKAGGGGTVQHTQYGGGKQDLRQDACAESDTY